MGITASAVIARILKAQWIAKWSWTTTLHQLEWGCCPLQWEVELSQTVLGLYRDLYQTLQVDLAMGMD